MLKFLYKIGPWLDIYIFFINLPDPSCKSDTRVILLIHRDCSIQIERACSVEAVEKRSLCTVGLSSAE